MRPEYRIIFMLLALYMPPNMSAHRVTPWLAMILNAEISFTEKAVEDLRREAFIEESEPEIRIHDLYVEFAQSKANEMRKWLRWKGNPQSTRRLISQDNAGFELARLERCMHQRFSQISPHDLKNLLVLQLVGVHGVKILCLGGMRCLRSMTLHSCKGLKAVAEMEKLQQLGWLQISEVNPNFRLPNLSSLKGLQYLEIRFGGSRQGDQLADVSGCDYLREVNICCRSLCDFPRLKGLGHVEKVEFSVYDNVKGPFDFTECVELHRTVIDTRSRWAALVKLSGYNKVSKTVLWDRDAVKACRDIDMPSALESCSRKEVQVESFNALEFSPVLKSLESCRRLKNLHLWNLRKVEKLPNFRLLSKLTVLKVGKCGIRDPPDLRSCELLEDVCFTTLEYLESFPNFSGLRKLKKLRIYNCWKVEGPPDVSGCNELKVFHLVYNDNMKGLPSMGEFLQLDNIKLSWQSEEVEVASGSSGEEDVQSDLVEFDNKTFSNLGEVRAPNTLKEWGWLEGKRIQGISYVREGKKYYSITAPYESEERRQLLGKVTVVERVLIHPIWILLGRLFWTLTFASITFIIGIGVKRVLLPEENPLLLLTKGSMVSWIIGVFVLWAVCLIMVGKRRVDVVLPLTFAAISLIIANGVVRAGISLQTKGINDGFVSIVPGGAGISLQTKGINDVGFVSRVPGVAGISLPIKGTTDIVFCILALFMVWIYFLIVFRKQFVIVWRQIMSLRHKFCR